MLIGCALVGWCWGAAIEVRVVGTTPTQAILSYTAPSDDRCALEVSASPSFVPPVHDLDPSLFAGANFDNRPGNVNQGRQRVFVIGKRSAEAAAKGHRVSRALQVSTTHYFRLKCGTAVATGSFSTANLAAGKAYPEIPMVDRNHPGEYSWPDMAYGDRDPQMIDPLTGILFKPLSRPGENTEYWPYGSQTSHCSASLSQGGYHCDFAGFLYWINPATGESRFLGRYGVNMYFPVGGDDLGGSSCIADSSTFRPDNPDVFYCPAGAKTGAVILEGTLKGRNAAVEPNGAASITWRNLTPFSQGKGLSTLAHEFDPSFDPAVFAGPEVRGILGDGNLVIDFKTAGQDSPGWLTVFDPRTSRFVAMHFTGTTGIHSYSPVLQSDSWVSITYQNAGHNSMWNYRLDPHGNKIQDDPIDIGHAFVADRVAAGYSSKGMNVRLGASYAAVLASPGTYVAEDIATFGQGGLASENFIEDYTSQGPVTGEWILNARPIEAANNITSLAPISGQLYRVGMNTLNAGVAGSGGARRKLYPTFAYCGSHPLMDISGPKSVIDDTPGHSFRYCVAAAAGECQDSNHVRVTSAGEIYANCPRNDGSTCTGNEGNRGLCVMELGSFSGQITQIATSAPQKNSGPDVRALTWGFQPFHIYGGYFWSARSLPDGSWMMVRSPGYRGAANTNFVAKMPPMFKPDGIARDRFVLVPVTVPALAGASRAWLNFGYAENGTPESFYCTSRQEACVAVDSQGQRSGQIALVNGVVTLKSGDPFNTVTWRAGTKVQIMGNEWPLTGAPKPDSLTVSSVPGPGTVSAAGSVVTFSNPGECVKHAVGTRITVNGISVTVKDPWQCDGTAKGNHVGVQPPVNWAPSAWTWDLGNLDGSRGYVSTFHYASEPFMGQPCSDGCKIQIPAISQRILYYKVTYDNGTAGPIQAVAVP
jgi:hypothetical protein